MAPRSAAPGSPRHPVEWIGHRGAPREYPENTLPAFQRAIELGADAIELDVHVTFDGVPIVHHDPQLRGSAPRALATMTWSEVARVELVSGIAVPSLQQVLDAVGD